MSRKGSLCLTVHEGSVVEIGNDIRMTFYKAKGSSHLRIRIQAPTELHIKRSSQEQEGAANG